nr:craniofacial development protein 2-like [Maniola hyperantus]
MSSRGCRKRRLRDKPNGGGSNVFPPNKRLLHQGRVQRKKRVREVKMRMISWNVGTMTGRGRELADVLEKRRINVACLQETRWKGTKAREIGAEYKFFYSVSDGRKNGVGVVLDKDLKKCVTDVNRVNDRIIVVKLVIQNVVVNIVSVYAPQVGCDDEMKETFWKNFDAVMMGIPQSEEIYIGGDFNSHVGRTNENFERVHGSWGFGTRNREGETLLQSASAFDMVIVNTFFEKRDQHLITYQSGNHRSQIDYFLISRKNLNTVKDCKVIPGEPLASQHRLLLMEMKVKVQTIKSKPKTLPKIKWYMIEKEECAIEFQRRVVDKMIEMDGDFQKKSVNECWNEMASFMRSVAMDIFGETKNRRRIDKDTWWWSEDVQKVLKEKKDAFKEWKGVSDSDVIMKQNKREVYMERKKKAKRAVGIARGKAQEKLYRSLKKPPRPKRFIPTSKSKRKECKGYYSHQMHKG